MAFGPKDAHQEAAQAIQRSAALRLKQPQSAMRNRRLEGGAHFRVLIEIDQFIRECLKLEAAAHFSFDLGGSPDLFCKTKTSNASWLPVSPVLSCLPSFFFFFFRAQHI
jgi:hypothetical protein